jgi:hypothetical protein
MGFDSITAMGVTQVSLKGLKVTDARVRKE